MSESGSTRFPNAPSLPERGQTTRDVQARVVELVQAAKEMKEMRDNTRLQGRVERVDNAERRVTLRTERGDIEVKYPKDQPLPKDGERVEITIQNGKNVTIKTIPNTQPDTQDTQTRPSATPVDVIISNSTVETRKTSAPYTPPTSPETTIKPLPQTLPPEGSVVRLTPLPAQELMHVLDPVPIQSLPQTLSAQISFQANLIVQDVQAEMQQLVAPVMIDPQQIALLEAPLQAPLFSQTPTLSAPQNAALPIVLSAPKTESLVSRLFSLPIGLSPAESTAPPMNTAAALSLEPLPLSTMEPVLQETLQAPASSLLLQSAEAPIETLSLFTQTPEPLHVRLEHFEKAQMPFNLPEHLTAEQKASPIPLEQLITQGHRAEVMSARIEGLTKDHLPVLSFPALEGAELQYFTLQAPVESVTPGTNPANYKIRGPILYFS